MFVQNSKYWGLSTNSLKTPERRGIQTNWLSVQERNKSNI